MELNCPICHARLETQGNGARIARTVRKSLL